MSRSIPTAMAEALAGDSVELFYAVELSFDSGTVRLWTGVGDRTIDGETYVGGGSMLNISGLEEGSDLSAKGATVTLAGANTSILSLALQEPFQQRRARILFGVKTTGGSVEFVTAFAGYMNQMPIKRGASSATVGVTIESKHIRLQRAANRRRTDANHRARYANDSFFSYVADLQDKEVMWGRK